jgi:hypothetical protein
MRTPPPAADERPEGLPPTPAGAFTLGLRNFANELASLSAYLSGDRSLELQGQDSETVRVCRCAPALGAALLRAWERAWALTLRACVCMFCFSAHARA